MLEYVDNSLTDPRADSVSGGFRSATVVSSCVLLNVFEIFLDFVSVLLSEDLVTDLN